MRIFLDTNVLIDIICQRDGYERAGEVLAFSDEPGCIVYTSVLSVANIAYILRKVLKGDLLYKTLEILSKRLKISSMTQDSFDKAVALKASDFEDALQYYSALQEKCELIVTRNKKDFLFSKIMVCTPDEFLENYR